MRPTTFVAGAVLGFCLALATASTARAQPSFEQALADLAAICLFEPVPGNPFSQAAATARQSFAPGITGFLESNLAALPLTPPGLEAEYADGEVVSVVTGFAPVYTESASTVGKGLFLVGTSAAHFNLSKIRGEDLGDLRFAFEQDGGGDRVVVDLPLDISATAVTLHGTYGVTNRFDVSVAVPIVSISIDNVATSFRIEGDNTGCRYGGALGLNCDGVGEREVAPTLYNFVDASERQTFVETVAVRAKYRFPVAVRAGQVAAAVDLRLPVRGSDTLLGRGNFGTRLTLVGEYNRRSAFQPHVNLGATFWNGASSNSFNAAAGFNQQVGRKLFFSFDLLAKVNLETDPFLTPIGGALAPDAQAESNTGPLVETSLPALDREHTLNAGLGLQYAVAPGIHAYGSALFSLLNRGLQSTVAPTVGIAAYF